MMCVESRMRTFLYLSKSKDCKLNKDVTIEGKYARLLKPFQIQGIRFLYRKFLQGGGVILNDESGLGKTIQAVLFLSSIQTISVARTLILCHEDKLKHWLFHFLKWSSENAVLCTEDISQASFVIAPLSACQIIAKRKWDIIVVDELDPLNAIEHLSTFNCSFKVWLTNANLHAQKKHLYKILDWVSGSTVGTQKDFDKIFSSNNEELHDLWKSRQYLHLFCSQWLLKRTKTIVSCQLPINSDDYSKCFADWLDNQNCDLASLNNKADNNESLITKPKRDNRSHEQSNKLSLDQLITNTLCNIDESSPSILHFKYTSFSDKKDECSKRKGKDDTGLKIKRSKIIDQDLHQIPENITPVNQTILDVNNCNTIINCCEVQDVSEKCSGTSKILKENLSSSLKKTDYITNVNQTQPDILYVKSETNTDAPLVDDAHSEKDIKFHLLDSLFSDEKVRKCKSNHDINVKIENCEDGTSDNQNKCINYSPEDHSKKVVKHKQFSLLDDIFFAPQNTHK